MKQLNLNQGWRLHEAPLSWNVGDLGRVMALEEGWMSCKVPCDVRMPLIELGIMKDPALADYCFDGEWTANRSWWFVREFDSADLAIASGPVELCMESLDTWAEIFFNGDHIGTHISAHYPFRCDLKARIRKGVNVLAVRLTTGIEKITEEQVAELDWCICHEKNNGCPERGDLRRTHVRRPQYNAGWDWSPKAYSIGIMKDVTITCHEGSSIRSVNLMTLRAEETAQLRLSVEIEHFDPIRSADGTLQVSVYKDGTLCVQVCKEDFLLTSGENYVDLDIAIPNAKLWWPAGYGEQPLYDVDVELETEGCTLRYPRFHYGIRTVALDTSRNGTGGRNFELVINGVSVFCKGANWIPNDTIYARVSKEKYVTLIEAAKEANFNMLRVWGGGNYETDCFYDLCDRHGILLWHDFMLACGACPDHEEWFRREVEREANHQTKKLRTHPCIALWCGDNELHRYLESVHIHERLPGKHYGVYAANYIEKRIVHTNCPQTPFWNSSPYGGDYPDSELVGDTHYWDPCTMNPDMAKRINPFEYDRQDAAFVSEYGYIGPCARESIETYFDGKPIDRSGHIWDIHNNTFEQETVCAGIEKHYLDKADELALEPYILYAGMVQSLMLGYSLEAIRFKTGCGGSLFWMYNDTWGEVGWTIIDYYLRKKPSYYGVKRAFAHRKLILRQVDGRLLVTGCNDTAEDLVTKAEFGYVSADGTIRNTAQITLTLPAHSRTHVLDCPMPDGDKQNGFVVIIPEDVSLAPERLYTQELRNTTHFVSLPNVLHTEKTGDALRVTLKAEAFTHGVYFEGVEDCTDNYFELLPGEIKTVVLHTDNCRLRVVGTEAFAEIKGELE